MTDTHDSRRHVPPGNLVELAEATGITTDRVPLFFASDPGRTSVVLETPASPLAL